MNRSNPSYDYNGGQRISTVVQPQSRRSLVLRRVLEYVNAGAWWMERNGLLVFGDKEKVQACIESR